MNHFYWTAFKTFFRIGAFTIGGGYAMIPMIESEVVDKHKWLSKEEFLDLIAVAQSCPGVFAINMSIFIGYKLRKIKGAIAASTGTALPSFVIIRGGTDCRAHVQLGTVGKNQPRQLLDSNRQCIADMADEGQPHLCDSGCRRRRLSVRTIH